MPTALGWCRLQWPLDHTILLGENFIAYVRVFHPGTTDQSDGVDAYPYLIIEGGYGPDGSDPTASVEWTWIGAEPNSAWSAAQANEPKNDEYQTSLQPYASGTYDFAFRASADSGLSWTYCDKAAGMGADGSENGYQTENAGSLTVTPP